MFPFLPDDRAPHGSNGTSQGMTVTVARHPMTKTAAGQLTESVPDWDTGSSRLLWTYDKTSRCGNPRASRLVKMQV